MKILLVASFILNSVSLVAGSITNRKSLEVIYFDVNQEAKEVVVTTELESETQVEKISLLSLEDKKDYHLQSPKLGREALFHTSGNALRDSGPVNDILMFTPIYLGVGYMFLAADIAFLPFKLADRLISNSKTKKDIKVLSSAISNDSDSTVSSKRFSRILNLLENVKVNKI